MFHILFFSLARNVVMNAPNAKMVTPTWKFITPKKKDYLNRELTLIKQPM